MGILQRPTWWEDKDGTSPPVQWEFLSHSLAVTATAGQAAIFTGDVAFPVGTPIQLSAATMPGGFSADTIYYTTPTPSINPFAFGLSTAAGSAPLEATSAGTTVVGTDRRFIFDYLMTPDADISLLMHFESDLHDESGYDNVFTTPNSSLAFSTSTKKFGTASLQGSGSTSGKYATVPLVGGGPLDLFNGDFTVEFWLYCSSVAAGASQFLDWGGWASITPLGFGIYRSSAVLSVQPASSAYGLIMHTTGSLVTDTWHHIAFTRAGTTGRLFLDGVQQSTTAWPLVPTTTGDIRIGGDAASGTNSDYMAATDFIDELRVTKGLARYTANFTPPTTAFDDPNLKLGQIGQIKYIADALSSGGLQNGLFGTARIGYNVVQVASDSLSIRYNIGGDDVDVPITNTAGATGAVSVCLDGASQFTFGFSPDVNTGTAIVALYEGTGDTTYGNVNFNCSCPDDENSNFETLATLRTRMYRRLGFSAQVDNPPPGMDELLTDFLQSAQKSLFKKYPARFTRRFFRWQMQAGERFFGIKKNDDDIYRNLRADFSRGVEWSGIQDSKNTWTPIFEGIMPELYTMVTQLGRPVRYEIRDCIEIFPAPDGPYNLWLKAHIELQSFTADDDQTTIDSEVVFLHALAMAKAHYGQADATAVQGVAMAYLGELCAGTHLNKRYIPGAHPVAPIVKPALIQFQDGS